MRVGPKQIELAKQVNLIDFLESEFPNYIEQSRKTYEYIHPEHDSLKLCATGFYRFSNDDKGDQIRYLTDYVGLSFPEAVLQLCRFTGYIRPCEKRKAAKDPFSQNILKNQKNIKEIQIPSPNENTAAAFNYLTVKRGLSEEIIRTLISQGLIYEDKRHNVIFINRKLYREFAIGRGTTDKEFKRVYGEGNNYWVFEIGKAPDVFICEGPIDAISLYEMRKAAGVPNGVYIAMGGLKPNTVEQVKQDYCGCRIRIAPDWDEKGIEFAEKWAKEFKLIYLKPKKERLQAAADCKDWNELLLAEKK